MREFENKPFENGEAKIYLFSAVIYTAWIFVFWTIYVLSIYPSVNGLENLAARSFLNEFIRLLIFAAPVFLILKFAIGAAPISFLKLGRNMETNFLWGFIGVLAYSALVTGRIFITTGDINPKSVPLEAWFTVITTATVVEEIAFRGFLLQSLERVMKFWAANIITAFIFVAIHLPGWLILSGASVLLNKLPAMTDIFFLGLLSGILLKKSGSLWACVFLHAANNLFSIMLFS